MKIYYIRKFSKHAETHANTWFQTYSRLAFC